LPLRGGERAEVEGGILARGKGGGERGSSPNFRFNYLPKKKREREFIKKKKWG